MWRELLAAVMRDFDRAALLNGNRIAGERGRIDGRPRRGDIKRNAVLLGENRDVVRADLVGEVAVGGDAVCSDDDGLDSCRRA